MGTTNSQKLNSNVLNVWCIIIKKQTKNLSVKSVLIINVCFFFYNKQNQHHHQIKHMDLKMKMKNETLFLFFLIFFTTRW